jgi:uncharacterized membrane protein
MTAGTLLALAAALAISCHADADASGPVRITAVSSSATQGELTVGAAPDFVYRTLVDYANWPGVFTYLDRVTIHAQQGERAEVTTDSRSGKTTHLRFHNDSAHRVVRFAQVGGPAKATAEIVVAPGSADGTTSITVRLTATVTGAAGWFVSDSTVREKRVKKITEDLEMLRVYFAPPNGFQHRDEGSDR